MSADKRTPHTDALETLGTIITEAEKRDAIHLAVENVIAGQTISPGSKVGWLDKEKRIVGRYTNTKVEKALGIADPFLENSILAGQRFWLVVTPREITSLRHVWTHPDFPIVEEIAEESKALSKVEESKKWIEEFVSRIPLDYAVVMNGAEDWLRSKRRGGWGEYLCFGGLLEGEYVPDEFWMHYEIVTDQAVEEDHRGSFFTCSC